MRGAFRRPTGCGVLDEPKSLPVLLRLFNFLFSSSSLHAFNLFLQFPSSTFRIVFGCLGSLFPPSISSPSACAFRRANHLRGFFWIFFLFFCLLFFCYFFDLLFYAFLVLLTSPGDPKIKANLIKIYFGRGLLNDFHSCANFWQNFIGFSHFLLLMDAHFSCIS